MTGEHASYTRANFLADLESVMKSVNPTDVYMTSRYDMHYDHAYFGLFGNEAIKNIQKENDKFQPTVHEAIIHSHMTDEVYPKDQGNYGWGKELNTYLGAWQHLDGLEEKTMLNWSERENVLTPYSMRQGPFKYNLKDKALREYTTEYYNWIASFSKVNEVFYKHETNSIGLFADITASSENSSDSRWDDQSAVKAVDGIADGYATGLANLHTRFPWAEWVTKNEGAGAWLNLAFNEEYKVSTIKLYDRPNTDDQITASHLELDDGTRIEVGELPNDGSVKIINLGEEKVVKNIKFVVDKVSDSTTAVGLAEIEVLGSKAKEEETTTPEETTTGDVEETTTGDVEETTTGDVEETTTGNVEESTITKVEETTTKKTEETTTKKPDVTTTGSSNQEVTTGTLTDGSSVKSPAKVKKVKISAKKTKVTVTWKKNKKAKGYEISYATNKKFKKASKVNVKKNNKTKKVLTKIKSNKVYYIKVRAYVIVNGKKVYGKYSKVRKIRSK